MKRNANVLVELRTQVRNMLQLMEAGGSHPKLSQARGYVDGYMQALIETGQASQRELLELVSGVRAELYGQGVADVQLIDVA